MTLDALITRQGASAVSLKTLTSIPAEAWDGILRPGTLRGADVLIPNRMGQTYAPQQYDAYTFPAPLILLGASQTAFQDNLAALKALIESSRQSVVFSRKVPRTGGDLTTSCRSRVRLAEVGMVNGMITGRLALEVMNLDGCWYGAQASSGVTSSGATITNPGDAPTNRLTLTFPGAGTLDNTTTGGSLTVAAACTITVETRTTTGALSGVTVAGDPFGNWFALIPGANVLDWSAAGSVTVAYNPAYQ